MKRFQVRPQQPLQVLPKPLPETDKRVSRRHQAQVLLQQRQRRAHQLLTIGGRRVANFYELRVRRQHRRVLRLAQTEDVEIVVTAEVIKPSTVEIAEVLA